MKPEDIERYMKAKTSSNFFSQTWAQFKRRLNAYKAQPKEMLYSSNPFLVTFIYMIILLLVLRQIDQAEISEKVLTIAFPIMAFVGVITTVALFFLTPVQDKEDRLRYLLNFAGMRSSSYFLGLLMGDIVIFTLP